MNTYDNFKAINICYHTGKLTKDQYIEALRALHCSSDELETFQAIFRDQVAEGREQHRRDVEAARNSAGSINSSGENGDD